MQKVGVLLMGRLAQICSAAVLKLAIRQNYGQLKDPMTLYGCITGF
jgi:hypothetical protein